VQPLLIRGLIVGLVAGLLAFGFAQVFGEPQVDRAIAFEDAQAAAAGEAPGDEVVSRDVQSSIGLLSGAIIYGVAIGGLFSIAFAAAHGRIGRFRPRVTAAVLGLCGYVVVFLVPFLKYPGNPPAVGDPNTIGERTTQYVVMILISILAAVGVYRFGRGLVARLGTWNAALAAVGLYVVVIAFAMLVLPAAQAVTRGFPADVLWHFRIASMGTQLVIWTTLGLGFGALAERHLAARAAGVSERRAHNAMA
jgi:predicted cobalt transporter CbtA